MPSGLDFGTRIVPLSGIVALVCVLVVVWLAARAKLGAVAGLFSAGSFWMSGFHLAPGLSLLTVLLGGVAVAGLLYLGKRRGTLRSGRETYFLVLWLALWWSWVVFLLLVNAPPVTSDLLRVVLGYLFPLAVAAAVMAGDVREFEAFARGFVLGAFAGLAAGLWWVGVSFWTLLADPFAPQAWRLGRLNYHETALMSVSAFGCCLGSMRASASRLGRVVSFVAMVALAYFVVLIGAREGFVGLAIVFLLSSLWSRRGQGRVGYWLPVAAGGVALVLIFVSALVAAPELLKLGPTAAVRFGELGDLFLRAPYYREALEKIAASPILGTGFFDYNVAHNLFLEALLDQGVVGLFFLLGFLVVCLRFVRRAWRTRGPDARSHWSGALVATIAYTLSVMMATGGLLGAYHLYAFSILLGGLATAGVRAVREEAASSPITGRVFSDGDRPARGSEGIVGQVDPTDAC